MHLMQEEDAQVVKELESHMGKVGSRETNSGKLYCFHPVGRLGNKRGGGFSELRNQSHMRSLRPKGTLWDLGHRGVGCSHCRQNREGGQEILWLLPSTH